MTKNKICGIGYNTFISDHWSKKMSPPPIYPDGDILFFGDWFRVKDQAEAFEVAEEVEKFVRELIEALNLMPMKSD